MIRTISREELKRRIAAQEPNNEDVRSGYALVNVLLHEKFVNEHIPFSINIPVGEEDEFETRFDKSKEIILYCASPECSASSKAADELVRRGFTQIVEYEGGMSDWKEMGNYLEHGEVHHFEQRM